MNIVIEWLKRFDEPPKPPERPLAVAALITGFVQDKWGPEAEADVVLEGICLSLQMLAGPVRAAEVLRACTRGANKRLLDDQMREMRNAIYGINQE